MNAIFTKVIPQTETKPTRVKATYGDYSVIISYDCNELPPPKDASDPHLRAMRALCKKVGIVGALVRAEFNGGEIWVFVKAGNGGTDEVGRVYCETQWIAGKYYGANNQIVTEY